MKRLLVLLMLAAVSLSVTAATTIKGSKSNSSDREQAPATAVAEDEPTTAADKPTAGNGAKSGRYHGVLTPQGRVGGMPVDPTDATRALKPQGRPMLDADRMQGQQGPLGAGPAEATQLNSSRSYRTMPADTPAPDAAKSTIKTTKSNTFRARGTPESSPPKPTAAGVPSGEPAAASDKSAQDQKPFHF